MVFLLVIASGIFIALSNLLIRMTLGLKESNGKDVFLALRFLAAGFFSFLIPFYQHGSFVYNAGMCLLGVLAGLVLYQLQASLEKSLQYGPPAKTFNFVGGSSVLPALILFLVFGEEFGYTYSFQSALGMLLVVAGLMWMCKEGGSAVNRKWLFWVLIAFLTNTFFQLLFQWRELLFKANLPENALVPFTCRPEEADSFLVAMFVTAGLLDAYWKRSLFSFRRFSFSKVCGYGLLGAVFMTLSSLTMLQGISLAVTEMEQVLIFPLYCIAVIFGCAIWGSLLYKEKVQWPANALCGAGILVSSL